MKNVLGRGLGSLISTPAVPLRAVGNAAEKSNSVIQFKPDNKTEEVQFVPVDSVAPGKYQPRKDFREAEIEELVVSIQKHGVLQPVLVRPVSGGEGLVQYEIVAGERRWRAAKKAGLLELPVIIKQFDDLAALEVGIVENVQRHDLSPLEQANAYKRLSDEFGLSQEQISEKVGKDRASVANFLRLLKLPPEVLELLDSQKISMGHAKAILAIREPVAQISLAKKAAAEGISVRSLEELVSQVTVLDTGNLPRGKASNRTSESPTFTEATDRLREILGTKVLIRHSKSGKGRIEIAYFSEKELDRIIERICQQ